MDQADLPHCWATEPPQRPQRVSMSRGPSLNPRSINLFCSNCNWSVLSQPVPKSDVPMARQHSSVQTWTMHLFLVPCLLWVTYTPRYGYALSHLINSLSQWRKMWFSHFPMQHSVMVMPGPEGCCWHLPAQQRASASPTGSWEVFLPFLPPVLALRVVQTGLICWIPWMQWTRCRRDGWFVEGQGWPCQRPGRGRPHRCWWVTWNMGVSQLHLPHLRLSKTTNMYLFMIFKTDNTVTNVYKRCRQKK